VPLENNLLASRVLEVRRETNASTKKRVPHLPSKRKATNKERRCLVSILKILDELEALEAKATPGPWENHGYSVFSDVNKNINVICYTATNSKSRTPESEVNTMLIAASRNALPQLTRALRIAVKALEEIVGEMEREIIHVSADGTIIHTATQATRMARRALKEIEANGNP